MSTPDAILAALQAALSTGRRPVCVVVYFEDGSTQVIGAGHLPGRPSGGPAERSSDTPMTADIIEALQDGSHLTGPQLAARAGYSLSSHFRSTLARLRRDGRLHHDDEGYYRPV